MSATLVFETEAAYRRLRRLVPLGVLRSEKDYRKAMAMLDEIIREATGPEVLRSLMEAHGLTQCQKFSLANATSTFDRSAAWLSGFLERTFHNFGTDVLLNRDRIAAVAIRAAVT